MRRSLAILGLTLILIACSPAAGTVVSTTAIPPTTTPESTTAGPGEATTTTATPAAMIDPVSFSQAMRDLWTDHVAWTRLFIVSAVAGLPDTEATAGRLLQNQSDIGDAVASFYGEEAGDGLTALLRDHILIAADLVSAAKAGDQEAVGVSSTAWYAS